MAMRELSPQQIIQEKKEFQESFLRSHFRLDSGRWWGKLSPLQQDVVLGVSLEVRKLRREGPDAIKGRIEEIIGPQFAGGEELRERFAHYLTERDRLTGYFVLSDLAAYGLKREFPTEDHGDPSFDALLAARRVCDTLLWLPRDTQTRHLPEKND